MYEHRSEPLLNWREFLRRTGWHALAVVALLGASLFALYAGLLFIIAASVLLAPWLHRMLHRLHVGR